MIRRIIKIDKEKCNGCGACVTACHEDAIGLIDGKATLLRDDYCDGLGDCLPTCPTNAITFEEREALEYNEAEVKANQAAKEKAGGHGHEGHGHGHGKGHGHGHHGHGESPCGCPGQASKQIHRQESAASASAAPLESQLRQWPVQIKLAPVNAQYFDGANLLIAADCTAYAYADFHNKFIKNHVTLIGCPKLDSVEYAEKLTEIIKNNDIKSVKVVRMEVPCCGGIEHAAKTALQNSGKFIPWQVVTVTVDGNVLD